MASGLVVSSTASSPIRSQLRADTRRHEAERWRWYALATLLLTAARLCHNSSKHHFRRYVESQNVWLDWQRKLEVTKLTISPDHMQIITALWGLVERSGKDEKK